MPFYTAEQITELESNPILTHQEIKFAKEIFANVATATYEKSQYPIDSDGRYQAFVKIGEWLLTGTLRPDGLFATELGSWNYLVLDLSQAEQTTGIRERMDELDERERRLKEWFEQDV